MAKRNAPPLTIFFFFFSGMKKQYYGNIRRRCGPACERAERASWDMHIIIMAEKSYDCETGEADGGRLASELV